MAFNYKEYVNNYQKENYKSFKVTLKKEEKEHLDQLLKKANLKASDFLRNAIEELEKKLNSKKN